MSNNLIANYENLSDEELKAKNILKIVGKHKRTLFRENNDEAFCFKIIAFTLLEPIILDNKPVQHLVVKGKFANLDNSDTVTFYGSVDFDKKRNNYLFTAKYYSILRPSNKEEYIKLLTKLNGIGKKKAMALYDMFGDTILTVLEEDSQKDYNNPLVELKIDKVKGITHKVRMKLLDNYLLKFDITTNQLINFFTKHNIISFSIVEKTKKLLGPNALKLIETNPYRLIEVDGLNFYKVDDIAKSLNFPTNSPLRIVAGVITILKELENGGKSLSNKGWKSSFYDNLPNKFKSYYYNNSIKRKYLVSGSTYFLFDVFYLQLMTLLDIGIEYNSFKKFSDTLANREIISLCNINGNLCVSRKSTFEAEYNSAKKLIQLANRVINAPNDLETLVTSKEAEINISLSEEQRNAVLQSLKHPISIITGGAGTGKTSVQKVLLSVYKHLYPNNKICLTAPTGMAAKRMTEATGLPAQTIHKLLGIMGGDLKNKKSDYLEADLIIIDESSMIDIFVLNLLLERVENGTKIVFVGDIAQLPSVGCGVCFKHLIECGIFPITRLTKVFRQANGSSIALNSARINKGETNMIIDNSFQTIFFEEKNGTSFKEELKKLYPALVKEYGLDNVTVLSAGRKAPSSNASLETVVNNLNPFLRDLLTQHNEKSLHITIKGINYYIGDKIMYLKNTEERINGDVGYIKGINPIEKEIEVDFGDELYTLDEREFEDIILAYATTVHKSQGSEYPVVIMLMDKRINKALYKKNLIYTGVTRAKKKIYILGQEDVYNEGIITEDSNNRCSLLKKLLLIEADCMRFDYKNTINTNEIKETKKEVIEQIGLNI